MPVNISSSVSYTLGAAEDNLPLTGTANINGVGNALNHPSINVYVVTYYPTTSRYKPCLS